jgi:hypothetical protein
MGAHLEDLIPSSEPVPDWAVIRDLLRKASPNQIAQAKDLLAGSSPLAPRGASLFEEVGFRIVGFGHDPHATRGPD